MRTDAAARRAFRRPKAGWMRPVRQMMDSFLLSEKTSMGRPQQATVIWSL